MKNLSSHCLPPWVILILLVLQIWKSSIIFISLWRGKEEKNPKDPEMSAPDVSKGFSSRGVTYGRAHRVWTVCRLTVSQPRLLTASSLICSLRREPRKAYLFLILSRWVGQHLLRTNWTPNQTPWGALLPPPQHLITLGNTALFCLHSFLSRQVTTQIRIMVLCSTEQYLIPLLSQLRFKKMWKKKTKA